MKTKQQKCCPKKTNKQKRRGNGQRARRAKRKQQKSGKKGRRLNLKNQK
jgi:hypothetical protein